MGRGKPTEERPCSREQRDRERESESSTIPYISLEGSLHALTMFQAMDDNVWKTVCII